MGPACQVQIGKEREQKAVGLTGVEAAAELGKGGDGPGGRRQALPYPQLIGRWPDGVAPFVSGGGVLRGSTNPVTLASTWAKDGLGLVSGVP